MKNCIKFICCHFSNDPSLLDECCLDETTKEKFLLIIYKKLTQKDVNICAENEVKCYHPAAVQQALPAGIACGGKGRTRSKTVKGIIEDEVIGIKEYMKTQKFAKRIWKIICCDDV